MRIFGRDLFFGQHTFRKWFVSSMCIILLFIIIGLLLYMIALVATERTVIMAQQQAAVQTKNLIDLKLHEVKKNVSILTFNEKLLSASFIGMPNTGLDFYNYHKAGEELRGIYFHGNIKDIHVYYENCGCFIGAYGMVYNHVESFTNSRFGMSPSDWDKFASEQITSAYVKHDDSVYLISPLRRSRGLKVASLVVVELNMDDLKDILLVESAVSSSLGSYSYIISSKGEIIVTSGDGELTFDYGELEQGENYIAKNVITSKQIKNADWEYISVSPIDQYLKEVYDLRLILYIYIGFSIIFAVIIVYVETRRRYRPVLTLSENVSLSNESDIFQNLQEEIQDIVAINTRLTKMLKKEHETILSERFTKMIQYHEKLEKDQQFFQENFSMSFGQGVAVIISVDSIGEKLKSLPLYEQENIIILCLNNIGKELLGDRYSCFFWKNVDMNGVIWSDDSEITTFDMHMTNVFEQVRASVKKYFDVELRFMLSTVCDASSTLASAFLEAREMFEYAKMAGKTGVIQYDTSYTRSVLEWHHMDIIRAEQDFTSYMMERNFAKAKTKLEDITRYYRHTDGASIQLLKSRMFGLVNLVLNAIEINKTPMEVQFYADMDPVNRLLSATTIQDLEKEIMSIIEEIIINHEEKEETLGQKLDYIDRYIETYYKDQSLSVQQLADQVNLSISYVSRVYKEQRGIGILEVINTRRIERVKALLIEEPEMTLVEIAEKVGYGSIQTMMRVFKRMENKTPGEFRDGVIRGR